MKSKANWVIKKIKNHYRVPNNALVPFHKHKNILSGHIDKNCLLCGELVPDYIQFQISLINNILDYPCIFLNDKSKEISVYPNNLTTGACLVYYSVLKESKELFGYRHKNYSKLRPELEEYFSNNKSSIISNQKTGLDNII